MIRGYQKASLGLEITEDAIVFSQAKRRKSSIVVDKIYTIPIPPRTLVKNEIIDPETLAELIMKTLEKAQFDTSSISIALSHTHIPQTSDGEIQTEDKIKIEFLHEFLTLCGLKTVYTESSYLAALRSVSVSLPDTLLLYLFMDKENGTVSVVKKNSVLFTHSFSHHENNERIIQHIRDSFLAFSNTHPLLKPPQNAFFLSTFFMNSNTLLERLKDVLPDLEWKDYFPFSNIRCEIKNVPHALPSIGSALRHFEHGHLPTPPRKKRSLIKPVMGFTGLILGIILVFSGIFLKKKMKEQGTDVIRLQPMAPLYTPKLSEVAKSLETRSPLRIKLTGIIEDENQPYAICVIEGKSQVVSLNDRIEEIQVVRIEKKKIVLKSGTETFILPIGKEILL